MFIFNGLWCFFSDFKEEKGNYQTQTHRGKRSEAFKVTSRGSWKTQTSHYASNHFFERKKSNRSFTRCHNNLVIFRFFFHHALMKKKLSDKLNKKIENRKMIFLIVHVPDIWLWFLWGRQFPWLLRCLVFGATDNFVFHDMQSQSPKKQ